MITYYFEGVELDELDELPFEPVELVDGIEAGVEVFILAKTLALMYPAEVEKLSSTSCP